MVFTAWTKRYNNKLFNKNSKLKISPDQFFYNYRHNTEKFWCKKFNQALKSENTEARRKEVFWCSKVSKIIEKIFNEIHVSHFHQTPTFLNVAL